MMQSFESIYAVGSISFKVSVPEIWFCRLWLEFGI